MINFVLDRAYKYGYNRLHYSHLKELKVMARAWNVKEDDIEKAYHEGLTDRINNG